MDQHHQPGTPTGFPSPEERERIVRRRAALVYDLHLHLVLRETDPSGTDARRQELIEKYGVGEVERMLDRIRQRLEAGRPTGDAEEEWLYQDYVERYRRWGGQRPLLPMEAERRLNYERTVLKTRQDYHAGLFTLDMPMRLPPLSLADEQRLAELTDLLLADTDLWDDLVPDDPPAVMPPAPVRRPVQRPAPARHRPAQQLDNLVAQGNRLFQERKTAAACDRWLEAWALVRQLARPEHRTAFQFSQAYELLYPLDNWAGDLVLELGNAASDAPAYRERQLQFSREYLAQFPGAEPNTVVNMLRSQGEALWRMGRRSEAEQTYTALVERLPDEGWGYIGWSDHYWLFRAQGAPPEYEAGEAILKLALARPRLRDREYVLERLAELYEEWGKPAEHVATATQLAQLRQARSSSPPARKPGRNEPCWCGSGRKYKHCHLHADQAR